MLQRPMLINETTARGEHGDGGEVWQIGDVKITRVVEIEATGGMSRIIPDAKRELVREIEWLYPHFSDEEGRMRGAIHALIVDTPDRQYCRRHLYRQRQGTCGPGVEQSTDIVPFRHCRSRLFPREHR